jgi:hypothetical protein
VASWLISVYKQGFQRPRGIATGRKLDCITDQLGQGIVTPPHSGIDDSGNIEARRRGSGNSSRQWKWQGV